MHRACACGMRYCGMIEGLCACARTSMCMLVMRAQSMCVHECLWPACSCSTTQLDTHDHPHTHEQHTHALTHTRPLAHASKRDAKQSQTRRRTHTQPQFFAHQHTLARTGAQLCAAWTHWSGALPPRPREVSQQCRSRKARWGGVTGAQHRAEQALRQDSRGGRCVA